MAAKKNSSTKKSDPKKSSLKKPTAKKTVAEKKESAPKRTKPQARKTAETSAEKKRSMARSTRAVIVAREARVPGVALAASTFSRDRPFVVERLLSPEEVVAEYFARRSELDEQFTSARAALDRWMPELRKSKDCKCGHITGVSVRFRSKFGQTVSPLQVVIGVNVARKFRPEDVQTHGACMLPESVDGIPIKVVEGQFELLSPAAAGTLTRSVFSSPTNPLSFLDDLVGGAPIAPAGRPNEFGTLGVVVSAADGSYLGLTCQHVVQNEFQMDQRGPDVGSLPTTRSIGTVINRFKSDHTFQGVSETLDCASIELQQPPGESEQIVFPPTGNWIRGLSHPANEPPSTANTIPVFYSKARAEMAHSIFPLWKFGSASGQIVKGRIKDVDNSLFVVNGVAFEHNFTVQHFDGNQTFATPGDSGAVLGLEAEVQGKPAFVAIGILFAAIQGNSSVGLACNMSHVIDALSLSIPKKLLVDTWDRRQ